MHISYFTCRDVIHSGKLISLDFMRHQIHDRQPLFPSLSHRFEIEFAQRQKKNNFSARIYALWWLLARISSHFPNDNGERLQAHTRPFYNINAEWMSILSISWCFQLRCQQFLRLSACKQPYNKYIRIYENYLLIWIPHNVATLIQYLSKQFTIR